MNTVLPSLVVGLGAGSLFAAFGVLLTLMARLTRVVNLAQVAVGVFAAYLSIHVTRTPLPVWATAVIAVIAAAVLSGLVGWVVSRWLGEASTTARSAVTVGILLGLMSLSAVAFGTQPQQLRPLVTGPLFAIGPVTVTRVGALMLAIAIVVAAGCWLLLTRTRLGVRLRAIADRQTAAELMGLNVRLLQVGVWAVTGAVSGLLITIVGNAQAAASGSMVTLLIPSAAAALVGGFRSLRLTVAGGLLVGGVQGALIAFPTMTILADWVPIILIVLFLVWSQRKEVWDAAR